jgi:hypothetical protein
VKIGLAGDDVDQLDDVIDAGRSFRQFADPIVDRLPHLRSADSCTFRLISFTDEESSSLAEATDLDEADP